LRIQEEPAEISNKKGGKLKKKEISSLLKQGKKIKVSLDTGAAYVFSENSVRISRPKHNPYEIRGKIELHDVALRRLLAFSYSDEGREILFSPGRVSQVKILD